MREMVRIILSGGPCSGKSSAHRYLAEALTPLGYHVVFVPEVATRIIEEYGIHPPSLPPDQYFAFQELIFHTQLGEEKRAADFANRIKGPGKVVIVGDRGLMDCGSYMEAGSFTELLRKYGMNRVTAREGRYDAVFHLRTAADGAEEHYLKNFTNNRSRYEADPVAARASDDRTLRAWLGHPHLRIIDNATDFEGKMRRLVAKIKRALGEPEPIETERKYLVAGRPDLSKLPVPCQPVTIYQSYLADGKKTRIRWREQENEGIVYYHTEKIPTARPESSIEIENLIAAGEYWKLFAQCDPEREELHKTRAHFVWKNQHFELDLFHGPGRLADLSLLEIELDDENDQVELPDWLGPLTEVTADKQYKNRKLAKRPK